MMLYCLFLVVYLFGLSIHSYVFTCLEILIDSLLHPPRFFWSLYVCFFPEIETEEEIEEEIELKDVVVIINPNNISLGTVSI